MLLFSLLLPWGCGVSANESTTDDLWWAIQPLTRPTIPESANFQPGWATHPIDRFIAAKHAEKDLRPSPPADRQTFIRCATFNLTGLPPTPAEVSAFVNDNSTGATQRLIDRLLTSPRYGERWARHWMDVAHYAETHGHDEDAIRENAWPYRDWLIESFNNDKPYAGVRLVVVERLDEPVAVRPGVFADGILVVAVRLRIVGDVHPVPGPAFAVARTREQSVDQPLGRAGGVVVDECADFRRGGREPGEVEGRTPDERLPVGGRGRPEVFFGVFRRDKTVDRVSGPAGLEVSRLWYRGARQRLDRPPQIVGGRLIG